MTNLTPEEINRVLAEWDGWRAWESEGDVMCGVYPPRLIWTPPQDHHVRSAQNSPPIYTESLDLCAQIEAKLADEQWDAYCNAVCESLLENSKGWKRMLLSATTLQRATALVRALGLGGQ